LNQLFKLSDRLLGQNYGRSVADQILPGLLANLIIPSDFCDSCFLLGMTIFLDRLLRGDTLDLFDRLRLFAEASSLNWSIVCQSLLTMPVLALTGVRRKSILVLSVLEVKYGAVPS